MYVNNEVDLLLQFKYIKEYLLRPSIYTHLFALLNNEDYIVIVTLKILIKLCKN